MIKWNKNCSVYIVIFNCINRIDIFDIDITIKCRVKELSFECYSLHSKVSCPLASLSTPLISL
jgi:hypothetical protein